MIPFVQSLSSAPEGSKDITYYAYLELIITTDFPLAAGQ